jgi:Cu-Zn family superoxide dismutase
MHARWGQFALLGVLLVPSLAWSASVEKPVRVMVHLLNNGQQAGEVVFIPNHYGLLVAPRLSGLPPGLHGFHVHEKGDCGNTAANGQQGPGLAAGGHLDPRKTGKHLGPYEPGHLGDLPALYVGEQGYALLPVLAPRLTIADLHGHALMIHQGGDNYKDVPEPLGGGGPRIACGVIP